MAQDITNPDKQEQYPADAGEPTRMGPIYRPNADIFEVGDEVVVVADLPGVGPDDLDITLERRVLTIRGSVRSPEPEGFRQVYAEYGIGDFERVFTLSEEIDQDRIAARQKDGVLTLRLPKAAAAQPKKIQVATS